MLNSNENSNLFEEKVEINYDTLPIVLIDCSGSTMGSVFQYENDAICQILKNRNIKQCRLMYWSSNTYYYVVNDIVTITSGNHFISNVCHIHYSGTCLIPALDKIPNNWYHNDTTTDMYIVTDGEIGDEPSNKLKELLNKWNIKISILTVSISHTNYITQNIGIGGRIYNSLKKSGLINDLREFICVNKHHGPENPYQNLYNPDFLEGLVPYKNQYFSIEKLSQFLQYMDNIIQSMDSNSDNYRVELDRISYDLIVTLKHLTHGHSPTIKNNMIQLFSQLFIDTPLEINIGVRFKGEAENDNTMSCTFEEYRNKRDKLFKRGYDAITNSLKNNITTNYQDTYITFPIKTIKGDYVIVEVTDSQVKDDIVLGLATYQNAGVKIGKYVLPVLPGEKHQFDTYKYMCFRQWIRANYSQMYNLNAPDDMVMYVFLADMLKVYLKSENLNISVSLGLLVNVMLSRARFGSGGVLEKDYLLKGNPPAPVNGPAEDILRIFNKTMKLLNYPSMRPYTMWFGVIAMSGDINLIKSQYKFCIDDIKYDFPDIPLDNLKETLKYFYQIMASKFEHSLIVKDNKKIIREFDMELDYTCILTLEDTSDVGGYIIKPHNLTPKVKCNPRFVISKEGLEQMKISSPYPKCPICKIPLKYETSFCQILSKHDEEQLKLRENEDAFKFDETLSQRNNNLYMPTRHNVIINKEDIDNMKNDDALFPIDIFDFEPSFIKDINFINIRNKMNGNVINITDSTSFKEAVNEKYSFLNKISYDNCVIAGGFCRSILLNQIVNDIDFFFYGLDDESFKMSLDLLIYELTSALNEEYPNMLYTFLYKPRYNVVEMLCFDNLSKKEISNNIIVAYKNILECYKKVSDCYKYLILAGDDKEIPKYLKEQHDKYHSMMRQFATENDGHYTDINNIKLLENFANIEFDHMSLKTYRTNINGIKNYGKDLVDLISKITINLDLKHKIQFIVRPNSTKESILKDFDISASKVMFDGNIVSMTNSCAFAYKSMYNYIQEDKYSDIYYERLIKYFNYGFNILAPSYDLTNLNNPQELPSIQQSSVELDIVEHKTENKVMSQEELNRVKNMWNNIHCDIDKVIDNKRIIVNGLKQMSLQKKGQFKKSGMYESSGLYTSITIDYDLFNDDKKPVDELSSDDKKDLELKESTLLTEKFRSLLFNIIVMEMIDDQLVNIHTNNSNNYQCIADEFDVVYEDRIEHSRIKQNMQELEN